MWREFKTFLVTQNALALAIGVVIGAALNDVVKTIVEGLIMPIVQAISPGDAAWREYVTPGPIPFALGSVAAAIVSFLIVGFVAWRLSKLFIKPAVPGEAPATKKCQYCRMDIAAEATRCAHCTSELAAV